MVRITQLPAETTPTSDDLLAMVDNAGAITKKVTIADLASGFETESLDGDALNLNSVDGDKINFATFPIEYGSGTISANTTNVTFTPSSSGLLKIEASGRRNAAGVADTTIVITSSAGVANGSSTSGVGRGDTDGFASASYLGSIQKGVAVTFTVTTSGMTSNRSYIFYVIPGSATKIETT